MQDVKTSMLLASIYILHSPSVTKAIHEVEHGPAGLRSDRVGESDSIR